MLWGRGQPSIPLPQRGAWRLTQGRRWSRGGLRGLGALRRPGSRLGFCVGVEEGVRGWGRVQPQGWAMALPGREGDTLGHREESWEVHPAGEEFLPAAAVPLMNRPADRAAAPRALLSHSCAPAPGRCALPPTAATTNDPPGGIGGTARGQPGASGLARSPQLTPEGEAVPRLLGFLVKPQQSLHSPRSICC